MVSMNNLPYLITALTKPYDEVSNKGLEHYFASLKELNGKFESIIFTYQPRITVSVGGDLTPAFRQYFFTDIYPGNLTRFDDIANVANGDMNPDRWMVFTDAFDVFFQKELPDFTNADPSTVFYSSEDELWKDSSFFNGMIDKNNLTDMKSLGKYDIACAGGFAMTVRNFLNFVDYTKDRRSYYSSVISMSDQPMFNEWLWKFSEMGVIKPVNHLSLFGTLHNNINTGKIVKKDNKFYNQRDELYTMIHTNGDTKGLL